MTQQAEHEIEIKIMLREENLPHMEALLAQQAGTALQTKWVENCYYDTPLQLFAHQKMGLRVRAYQGTYEMTLKTKGEIIGGLHSRPEYHLKLATAQPDFVRLVHQFNLPFDNPAEIQAQLTPLFSTDFTRQSGLFTFRESQIEIALDRGQITAQNQHEPICEVELELKSGKVEDLLAFLDSFPSLDGIWFSSLSKAERGYLLSDPARFVKKQQDLTASKPQTEIEKYQYIQKVEDFIRYMPENTPLYHIYRTLKGSSFRVNNLEQYLTGPVCFREHLAWLKSFTIPISTTI